MPIEKAPHLQGLISVVLREKLQEVLLDSGIMNLMTEYALKNRHKEPDE